MLFRKTEFLSQCEFIHFTLAQAFAGLSVLPFTAPLPLLVVGPTLCGADVIVIQWITVPCAAPLQT